MHANIKHMKFVRGPKSCREIVIHFIQSKQPTEVNIAGAEVSNLAVAEVDLLYRRLLVQCIVPPRGPTPDEDGAVVEVQWRGAEARVPLWVEGALGSPIQSP